MLPCRHRRDNEESRRPRRTNRRCPPTAGSYVPNRGKAVTDGGQTTAGTVTGMPRGAGDDLHVLKLFTHYGVFAEKQVQELERNGVSCTVLEAPAAGSGRRSVLDYASLYRSTLATSAVRDVDLIHANYGLTAPMALAQPTRPVVVSLWGSDVFGTFGPVSKLCARVADEVIVMSNEMAAVVGTDAHVIPHGVDFDRFAPDSTLAARETVGWDPDSAHVIFPWTPARPEKDFPRAARVVETARRQTSRPIELHVVSDAPHEQMPTYMNAADALLMTSRWEGSPNSVREALACNVPVVATDVGDVANHVTDLPHSTVCDDDDMLADALVAALKAPEHAGRREQVRDLSLERMGDDILDAYARALE